jgi:type I restriction enzyme S subunit
MNVENNSTIEQSRNMPKGDAQSVPKGWVESTLGEVGRVVTGKTPSKNNPDDWGDKYDFITPSEIGGNNKYIYNTPRKLSDIGFERFSRMILGFVLAIVWQFFQRVPY